MANDFAIPECACVRCLSCKGLGYFWDEFDYSEQGQMHETCDECDGSGLSEVCDRCRDIEADMYEEAILDRAL